MTCFKLHVESLVNILHFSRYRAFIEMLHIRYFQATCGIIS